MKSLKHTLLANATFSLLSGLSLLVFASTIAEWMGITNPLVLTIVGIALLLFELFVTITAFGKPINKKVVQSIIIQDWLWVGGSFVLVAFQLFDLTSAAYWLISIIAIVVASFALLQNRFLSIMK